MPAAKKHPSSRARRNTASTASTLSTGPMAPAPKLPKRPQPDWDEQSTKSPVVLDWEEATLEWWDDVWASPMAAEYHSSDRHALFLLAVLVDEFWKAPSTKLASEIRLQRIAFGLTPYDRRRLEWTIETVEGAKAAGETRRAGVTSKQPDKANDPRLVLVK